AHRARRSGARTLRAAGILRPPAQHGDRDPAPRPCGDHRPGHGMAGRRRLAAGRGLHRPRPRRRRSTQTRSTQTHRPQTHPVRPRAPGGTLKITALEAIPYAIPYTHPLRFASGEVHTADHVLIRIHTDEGVVGTADAPPRPYTYGETQASIIEVVKNVFAPQIIGTDPFDREKIHDVMRRTIHNQVAKGAVYIALWDIAGKALGMPVHKLLGGWTDSMRVSHMLGFRPAQELLEEAQRFGEEYGITTFKLKV